MQATLNSAWCRVSVRELAMEHPSGCQLPSLCDHGDSTEIAYAGLLCVLDVYDGHVPAFLCLALLSIQA